MVWLPRFRFENNGEPKLGEKLPKEHYLGEKVVLKRYVLIYFFNFFITEFAHVSLYT